jgi:CHAT domain-containing protein
MLQNGSENSVDDTMSKLGMAPFDEQILPVGKPTNEWALLPASKEEIGTLHGTSLFNKAATKQRFITLAHNFNIIHLATHAYANDKDPNKSFIAFYPANPDSAMGYKLYQPEIYNLKLDKTRLVILSACESGVGELIKGEGLMSLSRAFSYAGCDNIITSMWKADDRSTAYISGKLHYYLQNGYSISTALKKAKLDYLDDDAISPAKKLPGYWAHMRLIGNFKKQTDNSSWFIYLSIIVAVCLIAIIKSRGVFKRPRRNKT